MRLWYQSLTRPDAWPTYAKALRRVLDAGADPGTEIAIHGIEKRGGIGDQYRYLEFIETSEVLENVARAEAEGFYAVHSHRPVFGELVSYMTSGPVVISILEGEGAILRHRDLMGATDPKKAAPGTIRADFAESIEANTVHGSDAPETAAFETAWFFRGTETFGAKQG